MKTFRLIAVIAILTASISWLQSCSDNGVSESQNSDIEQYVLYNYDVTNAEMDDATENDDIYIVENRPPSPDDQRADKKRPRHAIGHFVLGKVFRDMELTAEQKVEVRNFMHELYVCELTWFRKLHDARLEVLADANAQRRAIVLQVKNGEITRMEGLRLIAELNLKTRLEIRTLAINEEIREGIKLCRENFLSSISTILTEEQLVIWNDFLLKIKI